MRDNRVLLALSQEYYASEMRDNSLFPVGRKPIDDVVGFQRRRFGDVQMIDTSVVRVHQQGATGKRGRDRCVGRSRGGLTTKIHALVDAQRHPIQLKLTAGQASDIASAADLIGHLVPGAMLVADKGYDANALRALVGERRAWANIRPKSNRKDPACFSRCLYRDRNLIERFFNKIKQFRRIATRYDKLAENFLASLKLACVRIWLRGNESTA